MRKYWREAVFVGLCVVTLGLCHFFPNAATRPESGIILWLPDSIPGHDGAEIDLSDIEKGILPPDTTKLSMNYVEWDRSLDIGAYRSLTATLILAGADKRSLHKPEICLNSQGWSLGGSEVMTLETKGGPLEVMGLKLSRKVDQGDGSHRVQRARYVYWCIGRDVSTPHSNRRLLISAKNNIFHNVNDRWASASVFAFVDERLGDAGVAETEDRVFGFIQQYAPEFQITLGAKDRPDARPQGEVGSANEFKRKGDFFDPDAGEEE
jgi:hypothetical protein